MSKASIKKILEFIKVVITLAIGFIGGQNSDSITSLF